VIARDIFERKRLKVLNVLAPNQQVSSRHVLDDVAIGDGAAKVDAAALRRAALQVLKSIKDPEIPLNIYDLGLVYRLDTDAEGNIEVDMTLTSPGCPVAGVLVGQVHDQLRRIVGAKRVRTELVWEPPWSKDRLDEAARLALGLL
jgi:metal-sulfur cluster biosynthetic enzyme